MGDKLEKMNKIVQKMHNAYKILVEKSAAFDKRLNEIEKLLSKDEEIEVNENMSSQYKVLEEMINDNKEVINKIEGDIKSIENLKAGQSPKHFHENNGKKCKFFIVGYCKFKESCPYEHPEEICPEEKCENKSCGKRHPKACRYFKKGTCKFGNVCEFKHVEETKMPSEDNDTIKSQINVGGNMNENQMDVDDSEEIDAYLNYKCEWCNIDVRNLSSFSNSCINCEKSCCSSCSVLATNSKNKAKQQLSIDLKDHEYICAKCVEEQLEEKSKKSEYL